MPGVRRGDATGRVGCAKAPKTPAPVAFRRKFGDLGVEGPATPGRGRLGRGGQR